MNILLPETIIENPVDADGNKLHEGDRVYSHDIKDGGGYIRCYGTLSKSDEPATCGHWCVDYDDGESFIVLSWADVYKA
jgi:hypothetical protein